MSDDCVKCLIRQDQTVRPDEIFLMTQYLPYRLVRQIGERPCCFFERKIEQLGGVVAYFDIVGFTPIVAGHAGAGKDIGILSDIFRNYYSLIIETVRLMGGSVFQFAGDSILVCFERLEGELEVDNWKRALVGMYLALQQSNAYNRDSSGANGFVLDPKIGMGAGAFHQILLGSRDRFITPVIAGAAVDEAIASERSCNGREIVVGTNFWRFAQSIGMGDCFVPKNNGYLLEGLPEDFSGSVTRPKFCDDELLFRNPRYYNRINAFINPLIQNQIKTHFQGFVGEYRELTCVMVRFQGMFSRNESEFSLLEGYRNLNAVYELMQDKSSRFGGFCTKPDLSDKGTVFPVLFGAPVALENKELNAIRFADELLGLRGKYPFIETLTIGISTGEVYCGEFGGITRKDYTVVGSTVNFAARLMMMPETNCAYMDEGTRRKCELVCETDPAKGIFLKGFANEQAVHRYIGLRKQRKAEKRQVGIIGREEELRHIDGLFRESMENGAIRFCPIVGEAGMGKSYLAENFITSLRSGGTDIQILGGNCYQYEETTLLFPWRAVLKSVCGIPQEAEPALALERAEDCFRQALPEADLVWAPVFLNTIGYDFAEHETIREIDVSIKRERFFSIAYRLILGKAREKTLVIVLEDIHWSDAASLKMLEYLANGVEQAPVFILPVSRESDRVIGFFSRCSIPVLQLRQLREDAARKLTNLLLNLEKEEDKLVDRIVSTSECNPFFIENIVQSMKESGVLVEDRRGTFFLSKDINHIHIPSSIQNIILSRLNSLLFEEQVVCKTASVIGRTFLTDILRALVPEGISEYIFIQALESFETHNLILRENERQEEYYFKHITIRDVVYNTILESTRKELNMMLLSYLESRYEDNLSAVVERLEYHATEAEAWPKVYRYALASAQKSEKQFSTMDAIVHYRNALDAISRIEIDDREAKVKEATLALAGAFRKSNDYGKALELYAGLLQDERRDWFRAAILQGIGQCYQEQGKFDDAVSVLESSLALLGERAPKSKAATYVLILKEIVEQVAVWALHLTRAPLPEGEKRKYALMRCDILCVLTKLYYFGKTEKIAWASISNYNGTQCIADDQERHSVAQSNYAVTLVSGGFPKLGLRHFESSGRTANLSRSRSTTSLYKSRYAFYFLFYNQPAKSIELLEDAANNFRGMGEMWELMTAVGALAQNYFLISEFEKSEKAYLETERVARKLHSSMHIGWAYNKVPFIRYLTGRMNAAEATAMLNEGISMSESTQDHMTLCIHYGHLAHIAVCERNTEEAVRYAKLILRENRLYAVNIPHVKISYVNAVEAFVFALERTKSRAQRCALAHLAGIALMNARRQGKAFRLIEGPALRAGATLALYRGKTRRARELCLASLELLKDSPYAWEYANTLLVAARCFPDEAKTYEDRAREVFLAHNVLQW